MKNLKTALVSIAIASLCFALSGAYIQTRMPPGTLLLTGRTSCPSYTVAADGSSLLRAGLYANLFSAIGTTYGTADGSHFAVPNAKGVFLKGAGSQTISAISYSGTQGTTLGDEFQGHYHAKTESAHAHVEHSGSGVGIANQGMATADWNGSTDFTSGLSTSSTTTNMAIVAPTTDGSNGTPRTGSQTYPANITVLYCIWY